MRVLVTGGAGFIGSALVRRLIGTTTAEVLNVDALDHAGTLANVAEVARSPRHAFVQADIADARAMADVFARFNPDYVFHLAAEPRFDRAVEDPPALIEADALGTAVLLRAAEAYWQRLDPIARIGFRLVHVSSDEVHGGFADADVTAAGRAHDPASPCAATTATSEHVVLAHHRSCGLPAIVTRGSSTYGPFQSPGRLVPATIRHALEGHPIRLDRETRRQRRWLHVDDHVDALLHVASRGTPGRRHLIQGPAWRHGSDMATAICRMLDRLVPESPHRPHERLIEGTDEDGMAPPVALTAEDPHAIDWAPRIGLDEGLLRTVAWYVAHPRWWHVSRVVRQLGSPIGLARVG